LGAYLFKKNVLTISFAPRDNHEAQVQFALERGVPAYIGVLGSIKLPFPSRAFDMAHCSRCLIPWSGNGKNTIRTFVVNDPSCGHLKHETFIALFLQMVCT
jgi:hypothetical protein